MTRIFHATAATMAAAVTGAVLVATPAQAAPAGDSASWLARQLNNGVMHNAQYDYDDIGLTIDTGLALKEIGGQAAAVRSIRAAVYKQVDEYTAEGTDVYAGATAKSVVWAKAAGANPRTYGGTDLVKRLEGTVTASGRIADQSQWGDYANVIGQAFAARALTESGSAKRVPAISFLLTQQCSEGYFRVNFSGDASCDAGDATTSPADTDATALAVLQLDALPVKSARVKTAIAKGSTWLARTQRSNGSHGGGVLTGAANANSTGLAAWALGSTGRCARARLAATWTLRLQAHGNLSGTKLIGHRGAIAYNGAAYQAGKANGLTTQTRDQWRRTTAQAAPGLRALNGCL